MKGFRLKVVTGIILLISIIFTAFSVYAADYSADVTLTSDSNILKVGQTYNIMAKVKNISVGEFEGISTIKGNLEYNKEVFEEVKLSSFKTTEGWPDKMYKAETQAMLFTTGMDDSGKLRMTKADEDFVTLTIKVKDGITLTKSETITFKNMIITNGPQSEGGMGEVSIKNASVTLELPASQPEQPQSSTPTDAKSADPTPANTETKTTTATKTETKSKTKLPAAGAISVAGIVAIVGTVGTVCYIRFKKMNSYK